MTLVFGTIARRHVVDPLKPEESSSRIKTGGRFFEISFNRWSRSFWKTYGAKLNQLGHQVMIVDGDEERVRVALPAPLRGG